MAKDRDRKKGGGKEQWLPLWSSLTSTVSDRDVYYVMDEIKLSYVAGLVPEHGTTLEVGCGAARISAFLARSEARVFGIDQLVPALTVARRNFVAFGVKGGFICGSAYDLPFQDNTFDVVFSTGLLEHFEDPRPIVHEMVRVLKRGGVFWSDIVPSKFSLLRAFDRLRFESLRGKNTIFERNFSKGEIDALLRLSGVINVVVFSGGVFPPLWFPILIKLKAYRSLHTKVSSGLKSFWSKLDNTIIADLLGFYYLCYGRKE